MPSGFRCESCGTELRHELHYVTFEARWNGDRDLHYCNNCVAQTEADEILDAEMTEREYLRTAAAAWEIAMVLGEAC